MLFCLVAVTIRQYAFMLLDGKQTSLFWVQHTNQLPLNYYTSSFKLVEMKKGNFKAWDDCIVWVSGKLLGRKIQILHLHKIYYPVYHLNLWILPHPLCILQKSFACFLSVKVFQIFLSVSQDRVHMSLVFDSKFKSSENWIKRAVSVPFTVILVSFPFILWSIVKLVASSNGAVKFVLFLACIKKACLKFLACLLL